MAIGSDQTATEKFLANSSNIEVRHGLYFQARLLLLFVLFVATLEVAVAVYYKNILKENFIVIAEFDDKERDLLRGIMISSEMQYELSIPARGMVFLRVSLWLKRLKELNELEITYIPNKVGIATSIEKLQALLNTSATDDQLMDFIVEVKRKVNDFNTDIRATVSEIRSQREASVENYGKKSDYYALILLIIGASGLAIILVVAGRFLVGLMQSIKQLDHRAKGISVGNYGKPIETWRDDEIGNLIQSINVMAASLEEREHEVEDSRRRLFQQEKVYTVGSFAAGLAHEIGNPIQALLALNGQAIEMLMDSPGEREIDETIASLNLANEQIERLSSSMREMREFTHTGQYEKEMISLNDVIENSLRLMRFDMRFRTISIKTELSPNIQPVLAVSDHLTQALINLLVNAADAVEGKQGEIIVTTRENEHDIVLSISDNGMGMTAEQLDHILEPFFTTKEKGKGTGLGMSVCKQIVDEHNGTLIVNSLPGKGTTVTIRMPSAFNPQYVGEK